MTSRSLTPLAAGGTLPGFQFDSSLTPAEIAADFAGPGLGAGDPVTTSTVYIGGFTPNGGLQLVATPAATSVPEPATWLLMRQRFQCWCSHAKQRGCKAPAMGCRNLKRAAHAHFAGGGRS